MIIRYAIIVRLVLFTAMVSASWPFLATATDVPGSKSWSLVSPNNACEITMVLDSDGGLSYEALRGGKMVIEKSSLGISCNDQDFQTPLRIEVADKAYSRREKY